ncbi:MAG: hypothetical protein F6K26_28415 [Moorea sp. SIO2I5]|nr:hypothetical protein [Moorena sp. SIO2I5]
MNKQLSARELAHQQIRNTLTPTEWEENWQFACSLIEQVKNHRIMSHPIIGHLKGGGFQTEQMRVIHLEFYHAFVQVFTDSVIQAMFIASQLERRLGPTAKTSARFLLQFNLLEELGYKPGYGSDGSFNGNPDGAHYFQFFKVLQQLNVDVKTAGNYLPMASSLAGRATFENCYDDYLFLVATLAASETAFHDYANFWATGVAQATDIDVSQGYHSIHVEDETGESVEDGHAEDAWTLVAQALTKDRYDEVKRHLQLTLNTWSVFLDDIVAGKFISNQKQAA